MTKGDFYRDDLDRPQRSRTTGQRSGRLRRKGTYALVFVGFLCLLVVAAPSLVCQLPVARNLIHSSLAGYGFEGGVESIQVGWVTPLRIEGLELTGITAGSHLKVERVETGITLLQCLRGIQDVGELSIRGVVAELSVADGHSSIEDDLATLLADDPDQAKSNSAGVSSSISGKITAQDVAIRITDLVTKASWVADQSKAEIDLIPGKADVTFSTVLTDPQGGSGEIQGRIQYPLDAGQPYQLDVVTQRIPLSLASLAKRRLGESGASIPSEISGDTTGSMTVVGGVGNAISVSVSPMEFRNFVASDPSLGERVWRNGLTVISGSATVDGDRIVGRNLQLATDFGKASFDGAFNSNISLAGESNPVAWLEALDGSAGLSIDLVAFERAMPGLIPLRDQTEISGGGISAEITSTVDIGRVRRSNWNLQTEPIHARASGRAVVIEPVTLIASLHVAGGQISADTVRLESSFANATANGDLSSGRAKGDIQFSRLASMIQPLLELPEMSLAGQATGELTWAAEADNLWRLSGKTQATDMLISLPSGVNFQQTSVDGVVDATGRWTQGALRELSSLSLQVATAGLEANANLIGPVANPSATTPLPLRLTSRGRMEAVAAMLGPWMPTSINTIQGGYTANAMATIAVASGEVTNAKLQLDEPRLGYGDQLYVQPHLLVEFDGRYAWPDGNLDAKKMTVLGDALSAAVQGSMSSSGLNLEIAWRAKLDRLQSAVRPSVAKLPGAAPNVGASSFLPNASPVAFRGAPTTTSTTSYQLIGDCEGRMMIRQDANSSIISVDSHTTGSNVVIANPDDVATSQPYKTSTARAKPLWAERLVNVDTLIRYNLADGKVDAEKLQIATDWFATTLKGRAIWNEAIGDVLMGGTARVKMPEVATHLSTLLGTQVQLVGLHETPVEIVAARNGAGPVALAVNASIGWESGQVAGIVFGPTSIPITATETTVSVKPATIPVEQGRLQLAGDLHYSPGPMWMSITPGVVAEDLKLTPELTGQWLQYLAPMVANSTRVEGLFGIELAEAIVNIEDPMTSRVRGNLRITNVNLDSGPVANQIIGSVKQIQQLVRGLNADPTQIKDKRLVTFPTQAVDFEFANGIVSHQRMTMEIDRAKIITSGQVHADSRLNLIAQVPLDAAWLGSDLKGLAGQTVTLPIDGTLSRPSLDSAGIRKLVTEMGTKAIQGQAENYIEKQLGKGFEKLLGR